MYIQFGKINFCDIRINSTFSLSATPTNLWYQDDIKLLYDHRSDKKLFTTGADDDTTSVYITLDMGDLSFVTTVKLLNFNGKSGSIDISEDGSSWSSLYSFSNNSSSSLHWYDSTLFTDYDFITTATGEIIYTTDGKFLEPSYTNLARYIRITLTETIIPNEEKFIGELYIGQLVFNLTSKRIMSYRESITDPRSKNYRDYLGYKSSINISEIYNTSFKLLRPSVSEINFLKTLESQKLVYNFFPSPDSETEAIDNHLSIDSIYLVQAFGNYNRILYSQANKGVVDILLEETRIAT